MHDCQHFHLEKRQLLAFTELLNVGVTIATFFPEMEIALRQALIKPNDALHCAKA